MGQLYINIFKYSFIMTMKKILLRAYGICWRIYRGANKKLIHIAFPFLSKPDLCNLKLAKYGSDYGGWTVPSDHLNADSICYCIGVGLDASFDFELVKKHGCKVFSYDPTPMATDYMSQCDYDESKLHFFPIGVWNEDTQLRFYASTNPLHSNSVFDLQGTGEFIEVPCKKVSTLMSENGHDSIDLLKLDIEGAWHQVVQNIVTEKINISILCVELDSPVSLFKVFQVISELKKIGFSLVQFEKDNYLFVQKGLIN